jgi:hypothetical protein
VRDGAAAHGGGSDGGCGDHQSWGLCGIRLPRL